MISFKDKEKDSPTDGIISILKIQDSSLAECSDEEIMKKRPFVLEFNPFTGQKKI